MNLELRTLIYERKMEIRNVPVLTCFICTESEIPIQVVGDIKKLLNISERGADSGSISFTEIHEWADVILQVILNVGDQELEEWDRPLEEARQERINLLLDIYRFASDSGDVHWMNEVEQRLKQLSLASAELLLSKLKNE